MFKRKQKRKRSVRTGFVVFTASAVVGLSVNSAMGQDPTYRVTDLGVLFPGAGNESEAYDISNQNHVVGWSHQFVDSQIRQRAFLWMPDGSVPGGFPGDLTAGLNDLKVFAGADPLLALSHAYAIVRNGTEVRITGQSGETNHAFFWEPIVFTSDPNERLTDIGDLLNGSVPSTGWGITGSDPSYIVGKSEVVVGACINAFVWDSMDTVMTALPTPDNRQSEAFDIRERPGEILIGGRVGHTWCPNPPPDTFCVSDISDAVAWVNEDAATTLTQPFSNIEGEVRDLNDAGNLVGWGTDIDLDPCRERPLYWENTGTIAVILDTVPPEQQGRALGINSDRDVVGINDDVSVAVLWKSTGPGVWSYSDLNDLISTDCDWDLVEARAINDNGWIVGWGFHDDNRRAFLLTPLDDFCPADFNGDGEVSTADLLILFANWGDCPDASDGKLCIEDLDANCTVGTNDLLLLFADWGPCGRSGSSIPQNVQDCLNRYCCAPENLLALEKCICAVDPDCDPSQ